MGKQTQIMHMFPGETEFLLISSVFWPGQMCLVAQVVSAQKGLDKGIHSGLLLSSHVPCNLYAPQRKEHLLTCIKVPWNRGSCIYDLRMWFSFSGLPSYSLEAWRFHGIKCSLGAPK